MNESNIETLTAGIAQASATALSAIVGGGLMPAKTALAELTKRNNELLHGGDEAITDGYSGPS